MPGQSHQNTPSLRRLAAIMFTDIAGYTATMGDDEKHALYLLQLNRALQKPLIEKYGGKWLKEMGDGVLASFDSAYHAVKCAIDIQLSADEHLKNRIRIGIHLGDVTFEGNDIFGDGVNIASRLESIADPGGIYISDSIHNAIRSNIDIETRYLGNLQLKNVSNKIGTHAILNEGVNAPALKKIKELSKNHIKSRSFYRSIYFYFILMSIVLVGTWYTWNNHLFHQKARIESLAVLPFDNFTEDLDQEYFVAGIHDNLITALSQIGSLRIISKTSTLRYKSTDLPMQEIARELGVDAIVEASVMKAGDSIRINVQLIQAFPEEKHIWAQIFDRPMSNNILDLFNEITQSIVGEINLKLTPQEQSLLYDSKTIDPEAYKAYLNGKFHLEKLSPEGFKMALSYFKRSIEIDPNYALTYAELTNYYVYQLQMRLMPVNEAITKIYQYNRMALKLDPDLPEANHSQALMSWFEWDWEACEMAFMKVLQVNPNHVLANAFYSHLLMLKNRFDLAVPHIEKAVSLDPKNDLVLSLYGVVLIHKGEIDHAIQVANESMELNPNNILTLRLMEFSSYLNGDLEASINMLDKLYSKVFPIDMDIKNEYFLNGYNRTMENLATRLEKKSQGQDLYIALFFNRAGKYEKALYWLNKGYENHDGDIPYLFRTEELNNLKSDPMIVSLAEKVNLPL